MQHFFADPSCVDGEQIRLAGSDVNHMKNVLRMKPGEEVWKVMKRKRQSFVL